MASGPFPPIPISAFSPLIGPDHIEMTFAIGTEFGRKRAIVAIQLDSRPEGCPEILRRTREDILRPIAMLGPPDGVDIPLVVTVNSRAGGP